MKRIELKRSLNVRNFHNVWLIKEIQFAKQMLEKCFIRFSKFANLIFFKVFSKAKLSNSTIVKKASKLKFKMKTFQFKLSQFLIQKNVYSNMHFGNSNFVQVLSLWNFRWFDLRATRKKILNILVPKFNKYLWRFIHKLCFNQSALYFFQHNFNQSSVRFILRCQIQSHLS